MNWIDFIKPTKWKIITFLLLIVLGFISMSSIKPSIICGPSPCPQPFPYGNSFFQAIYYVLAFSDLIRPTWLAIIIYLSYLYIFSCLIIVIANKIKSREKG